MCARPAVRQLLQPRTDACCPLPCAGIHARSRHGDSPHHPCGRGRCRRKPGAHSGVRMSRRHGEMQGTSCSNTSSQPISGEPGADIHRPCALPPTRTACWPTCSCAAPSCPNTCSTARSWQTCWPRAAGSGVAPGSPPWRRRACGRCSPGTRTGWRRTALPGKAPRAWRQCWRVRPSPRRHRHRQWRPQRRHLWWSSRWQPWRWIPRQLLLPQLQRPSPPRCQRRQRRLQPRRRRPPLISGRRPPKWHPLWQRPSLPGMRRHQQRISRCSLSRLTSRRGPLLLQLLLSRRRQQCHLPRSRQQPLRRPPKRAQLWLWQRRRPGPSSQAHLQWPRRRCRSRRCSGSAHHPHSTRPPRQCRWRRSLCQPLPLLRAQQQRCWPHRRPQLLPQARQWARPPRRCRQRHRPLLLRRRRVARLRVQPAS